MWIRNWLDRAIVAPRHVAAGEPAAPNYGHTDARMYTLQLQQCKPRGAALMHCYGCRKVLQHTHTHTQIAAHANT